MEQAPAGNQSGGMAYLINEGSQIAAHSGIFLTNDVPGALVNRMSARGLSSASAAVIALSLYSTLAMAQSRGTINGTVKDSTGSVAFVEVSIVGSNATVTTDEQGRFRFTGVPFGTVEL